MSTGSRPRGSTTCCEHRHSTYKFIARKHGVVSFRFTHVENNLSKKDDIGWGEYDKNSLCSIFEHVKRVRFQRRYGRL